MLYWVRSANTYPASVTKGKLPVLMCHLLELATYRQELEQGGWADSAHPEYPESGIQKLNEETSRFSKWIYNSLSEQVRQVSQWIPFCDLAHPCLPNHINSNKKPKRNHKKPKPTITQPIKHRHKKEEIRQLCAHEGAKSLRGGIEKNEIFFQTVSLKD